MANSNIYGKDEVPAEATKAANDALKAGSHTLDVYGNTDDRASKPLDVNNYGD